MRNEWEKVICWLAVMVLLGGVAFWLYSSGQEAVSGRADRSIPAQQSLLQTEADYRLDRRMAHIEFDERHPFFTDTDTFQPLLKQIAQRRESREERRKKRQEQKKQEPERPREEADTADDSAEGTETAERPEEDQQPPPEETDERAEDADDNGTDEAKKQEQDAEEKEPPLIEVTYLGYMEMGPGQTFASVRVKFGGAEVERFVRSGAMIGAYTVSEFTPDALVLTETEGEDEKQIGFKDTGRIPLE